ncbi:glycoside hydrolase family 25 protein [Streptomyces sp. NPDC050560]|uniref:glycoside hydrolase family 25 protein n=1 Tax=Streptomyces sp. NPDC050560 TaxID=3365630 RepID=UPI003797D006
MATSRGVDVSAYQSPQNWADHKKDGVSFAFAKASEGAHTHDTRFATHITAIKAAGLVPGAYHFAWPNQNPATEAANYIAAVHPYAGKGFTHWLDLERYEDGRNYTGRSAAQINAYTTAWLAAVRKAFPGQRVGVYTSGDDLAKGHVPAGVPLWYPAYPGASCDTYAEAEKRPQPRPSGRTPMFWQFAGSPLDRSVCYLSAAELRTWAAGDAPKEDDPMPLPLYVNLGVAEPFTLAPGQDWDAIEFTTEWTDEPGHHATGGSVFARGPARFVGQLSLVVEGLPPGRELQMRQSEVDASGKEYVQDHPIFELVGTGGSTFGGMPVVNRLAKDRQMRIRIKAFEDTPVKIVSAVLKVMTWKES